jgi:hypothetical protein
LFADVDNYFPEEANATGLGTAYTINAACTSDDASYRLDAVHTSDTVDATDAADTDLLEEMENNLSSYTNPELDQPIEAQTSAPLTLPLVKSQPPSLVPAQPRS